MLCTRVFPEEVSVHQLETLQPFWFVFGLGFCSVEGVFMELLNVFPF